MIKPSLSEFMLSSLSLFWQYIDNILLVLPGHVILPIQLS